MKKHEKALQLCTSSLLLAILIGCARQVPVSPLESPHSVLPSPAIPPTETTLPTETSTFTPQPSLTPSPLPSPTPTYPPYSDRPFAVVFYRGHNLWLSEIGGGGERQLANETAEWPIHGFAVSPEGDRIAYLLYQGPPSLDAVIKQVHIPTGEVSVLLGGGDQCSESNVDWLDETHITFTLQESPVAGHEEDDSPCDFWGNEPFDHRVVDLTTGERFIVPESLALTQSPDGRYWLTGSCHYVYECLLEYVLHDRATGEKWQVAESIGWGRFLEWSPDSQWMLFSALERGETITPVQLVLISTVTREEQAITSDDKTVTTASWSPDGQTIAFAQCDHEESSPFRTNCGLWLMGRDGSNKRRILTNLTEEVWTLDWTPDGSRLVFAGDLGYGSLGSLVVWSVRVNGTDLRPIITQAALPHVLRER